MNVIRAQEKFMAGVEEAMKDPEFKRQVAELSDTDALISKLRAELAKAREDEREACARVAEASDGIYDDDGHVRGSHYVEHAHQIAAAIRARGK